MDIKQWLTNLGFPEYVELFSRERIDVDALPYLSDAQLKDMGVTILGDRIKLLRAISALSSKKSPSGSLEEDPFDEEDSDPDLSARMELARKYRLIRELGRGSMGVVYEALDLSLNRPVALKVLPSALKQSPKALRRMRREARTAMALRHPNIMGLYAFEDRDSEPFLVMEYIDGKTIDALQAEEAEERIPWDRVSSWLPQLLSGLKEAHRCGVFHRDLKPANVMIAHSGSSDEEAKLLDFGLALSLKASQSHSGGLQTAGTSMYASPEQILNQWSTEEEELRDQWMRSDQYSLAATLYDALSGDPPFGKETVLFMRHDEAFRSIKGVPEAANAGLRRALRRRREERWSSLDELAEALSGETIALRQTEAQRKAEEEAAAKKKAEEEAEAQRKAEEEARRKAEEEARRKAEEEAEAKRKAEEEAAAKKKALALMQSQGFVWIEPGEFWMGSEEGAEDERPRHRVRLTSGFWLCDHPVTVGEYRCFAESVEGVNQEWKTRGREQRYEDPVVNVSWEDVQAYLAWLNNSLPANSPWRYRLPTEAEWEYACRAGSESAYCFGDDAGQLSQYAWYDENSGYKTHPVKGKRANAWGLYDMHGNVWEWVSDWYGAYPKGSVTDPQGPSTGSYRVYRGGSWYNYARYLRSANRSSNSPGIRDNYVGARLCGDLTL
ncbi:MAG: SUMF1/EgtB/PvdO family nonheme iron enzyme [Planctomycetes bacterium]|nr:SUMF1/EgtB/PvdO family nonheme iron enzyme [Planctomycetota bacterium]